MSTTLNLEAIPETISFSQREANTVEKVAMTETKTKNNEKILLKKDLTKVSTELKGFILGEMLDIQTNLFALLTDAIEPPALNHSIISHIVETQSSLNRQMILIVNSMKAQ